MNLKYFNSDNYYQIWFLNDISAIRSRIRAILEPPRLLRRELRIGGVSNPVSKTVNRKRWVKFLTDFNYLLK